MSFFISKNILKFFLNFKNFQSKKYESYKNTSSYKNVGAELDSN